MFRSMRRHKQQLPMSETEAILQQNTSGVLSVIGDDGYPYGVPISYAYKNNKLYFHSALSGHKIDALTTNDKASFTVIDSDLVIPHKFTTLYRSAIAFGRIRIITDKEEFMAAAHILADRYAPESLITMDRREQEIATGGPSMHMLVMDIEQLTGKECIELTRLRD